MRDREQRGRVHVQIDVEVWRIGRRASRTCEVRACLDSPE